RRERVEADRFRTVYPWIQEINTLSLGGDLIEIEVSIVPVPHKKAHTTATSLLSLSDALLQFDDSEVLVQLAVEGNYPAAAALVKHNYFLTLHSDDGPDIRVAVAVGLVSPRQKVQTTQTPSPPTSHPTSGDAKH